MNFSIAWEMADSVMHQDELDNSKPPVNRGVHINGPFSTAMDREVLECIERMIPDWSFDVRPHGFYGSGIIIRIRLWKGDRTEEIDVNPFHYVDHPDLRVRENPTLAAVTDGITRFRETAVLQVGAR
jgi:hypothetical protein